MKSVCTVWSFSETYRKRVEVQIPSTLEASISREINWQIDALLTAKIWIFIRRSCDFGSFFVNKGEVYEKIFLKLNILKLSFSL